MLLVSISKIYSKSTKKYCYKFFAALHIYTFASFFTLSDPTILALRNGTMFSEFKFLICYMNGNAASKRTST